MRTSSHMSLADQLTSPHRNHRRDARRVRLGGAVVNPTMRASSPRGPPPGSGINRAGPVPVWRRLGMARVKPGVRWRGPLPMSVA